MTRRVADAIDMGRASCGGVGNYFLALIFSREKSENIHVLAFLNFLYLTVFEPLSVPRFDEKLIL